MKILFLNHKIEACGVYQYGLRISNILKKSDKNNYIYVEIDNHSSYLKYISIHNPDIIIYNYHSSTMSWLNSNNIQRNVKNICIPHESSCLLFDYIFTINPDEIETNNIYNIPRPIYENIKNIFISYKIKDDTIDQFINYNEGPDVPIFGSFGFGFQNKGFDKIIDIINQNYEKAIIKLVITLAHFDPHNDTNYKVISDLCKSKNINPNIKLLICNKFFTNEEILLFLNANNANIFLYDQMIGRGISSVIDYAISVNKPVVISDSYMFRHIYSHEICVYKTNIKDAINNSIKILPELLNMFSNKNLIDKIDKIINNISWDNVENTIEFKKKISAYYYHENNNITGDVTNMLYELYKQYKYQSKNTFLASNSTFFDTNPGIIKNLYININIDNSNILTLTFHENQLINWINTDKYIQIDNINNKPSNTNQIEVSIGEIIDKYSILELKKKYITNVDKLYEIQKEIDVLSYFIKNIDNFFYSLLLYINEQLWLDTDVIKSLSLNNAEYNNIYLFAEISNRIFENNQKRFRLKNYFNVLQTSNINEQKSYNDNKCFIKITNDEEIYNKIPEINYLCISYDIIYINVEYKSIFNKLFKNPNIIFANDFRISDNTIQIIISSYIIDSSIRDKFDFPTLKYKSSGKLGDFLNQLSVVCEKFYETGRKSELYIFNLDCQENKFPYDLEYTYEDTYNSIISQIFIKNYNIYNNEIVDFDLSSWRTNLVLDNWYNIYKKNYNVDWGKHKWFTCKYDPKWSNKIIINITPYRFLSSNALLNLSKIIKIELDNCIFISNEKEHYDHFFKEMNLNITYYQPSNFDEVVTIINSCKIAYLEFSSMAVIANSLHKNHIIIGKDGGDYILNNLKGIIPHVVDVLI